MKIPRLVMTMCLALTLPSAATAQTIAQSFPDLRATLKPGARLVVTDVDGQTRRGSLLNLTPSEIRVDVAGDLQRIAQSQAKSIAVIEHRTTALGPAIGGGVGLGLGMFMVAATRDCGGCGENGAPLIRMGFTFIGAAVGALIQQSHEHKRLVYSAPSRTVSVSPIFQSSSKGLQVQIRF